MALPALLRDQRLAALDRRIRDAWLNVLLARRAWARNPNAMLVSVEEEAERQLNTLLEQRFALQPRQPDWKTR